MVAHKVLLLGSGFVAKPALDVLSEAGIEVTIACRTLQSAKALADGVKHAKAISLNVDNSEALDSAVAEHDLVISLIPYTYHAAVIKAAIRNKKNVVTTSYVSPAMMELDPPAKEASICVLNEIGLDPGIDHLEAVRIIDEAHQKGEKIRSFYSYCGGLSAPEASNNPLGYKFSWSPRGVLLAARNDAKFYQDGKAVSIPGSELMKNARPVLIYPGFAFFGYPNRDSTPFRERYGIPECQNLLRGSLRYQGNPAFVQTLNDIGFLSEEQIPALQKPVSWAEASQHIFKAKSSSSADLEAAITSRTKFTSDEEKHRILAGLRWIGVFSTSEKITPAGTPLDVLCATLSEKCKYGKDERDMVMLQHKFEIEKKDGSIEWKTSTLCDFGDPKGYSSMAKLVGVTCAIATQLVLDGTINEKGIVAPLNAKINDPIRAELTKRGIVMTEETLA